MFQMSDISISKYKGSGVFHEENFALIDLTLEQLVESNFHIGARLSKFEKINFTFIFSKRFDLLVLNLTYSLYNLRLAVYFLTIMVSRRGKVLFFDNHEQTHDLIQFIGTTSRQYFINKKWIAGLLTNFKNFYPAVFTGVSRHFRFSETKYAGMRYIHRPPNVSCLLNISRGSSAFLENFRLGIPTIALVNSDNNTAGVSFPIFSNNNSFYTFDCFLSILRSAIFNGYKDEIYKFYRKSLKRTLKTRFITFRKKSLIKGSIFLFVRHFFVKLFFVHKDLFYYFFLYLSNNMQKQPYKDIIRIFLRDLTYFYDRLVVSAHTYSLYSLSTSKFSFDHFKSVDNFTLSDYNRFLKALLEIFLSPEFPRFFFNFYSSLGPVFVSLFSKFLFSKDLRNFNIPFFSSKLSTFFYDFNFAFSLLKKWFSFYSKSSFFIDRHFPHEFFPFLIYPNIEPFSLCSIPYRFLTYNHRSFLFPIIRSFKFLNLNSLSYLYRDFRKDFWFKVFKFSKNFKKSYRIIDKRLKFLILLWRSLYSKKRKFLTFYDLKKSKYINFSKKYVFKNRNKNFFKMRFFTGVTVKELIRRQHLRESFNNVFLKYFDEEFEDTPFPFNNEFFFLQMVFGNIFLTREAERNKILADKRNSSVTVVQERNLYLKVVLKTRSSRFLLYFPYFVDIFTKFKKII